MTFVCLICEFLEQDLMSRGGENVYPAEIEYFLHTHPKIQDVQVGNYNEKLNLSESDCKCCNWKNNKVK